MLYRLYRFFSINYARKNIFTPYFSIYIFFRFKEVQAVQSQIPLRYEAKLRTSCAFLSGTSGTNTV